MQGVLSMLSLASGIAVLLALLGTVPAHAADATPPLLYYAHDAALDRQGVIAPWYRGQNGQLDLRVRIAAETLKRYPWAAPPEAVMAAPRYVFSGAWHITPDGTITVPPAGDWADGDLAQRAAYILSGLVDYYRYSGDPAAIAHITLMADYLVQHSQTGSLHPWPRFLISVPTKGKTYRDSDPHGFIQLDIVAETGLALLHAYELTGNRRWLEAAAHWGDLLAAKRSRQPGSAPWGRYANPEDVPWEDLQTGGVVFILSFLDELIRVGHTGPGGEIVKARDAGRAYLRDVLLPRWTVDDTWGRNYWDWPDPVQAENVTEFVVRYMMENPREFPAWRTDCRNIMSLFLCRTGVATSSRGDVYSGAWAYPESSGCCGRSLWYGPMELATVYAQYGVLADSEWAQEMARRQIILATYDIHETGVVEDNIDGGQIVAGDWFKIAHPMALKHVLAVMGWLPATFGPARENHILRSSAIVGQVRYGKGRVEYRTFDAPIPCVDVLRLAFAPGAIVADGKPLRLCTDLEGNGYALRRLACGDCIVTIRHDGLRTVRVEGDDPQEEARATALRFSGDWAPVNGGESRVSASPGAAMTWSFTGNQVRVIGAAGPDGGKADVYVDGARQLVGIDSWCPSMQTDGVLYYRNGLLPGRHTIRVVVLGERDGQSRGNRVALEGVQSSSASGDGGFGEGGGSTGAQRVIFGYPGDGTRADYVDSAGQSWRPATEFTCRTGDLTDVVATTWWQLPRRYSITGTADPELYRHGVHARDFTAIFTVGPGRYHVRLKFAESRALTPDQRAETIFINGKEAVTGLDVQATAGGPGKAADLVFNGISPASGVISLRFLATYRGEAMVQAVEIGPGDGGAGSRPVIWQPSGREASNLLANPGFEETTIGTLGRMGDALDVAGWKYLYASPSQSYIWMESGYSIHPDWGLPEIHGGKEALRTHTDGSGHTIVYQDCPVAPKTRYRASVFVRAVDLHGRGFGHVPGDSAGLCIQELCRLGKVLVDHGKVAVTQAGPYTELSQIFTTGANTVSVRFILDTLIGGPFDQGHVTYDDCALVRVGEDASP
jgi:hypothetical protein